MTSEDFSGQAENGNEDSNQDEMLFTFTDFRKALLDDLENFEAEVSNNPDEYPNMGLADWLENFEVFAGW